MKFLSVLISIIYFINISMSISYVCIFGEICGEIGIAGTRNEFEKHLYKLPSTVLLL